MRTLSLLILVLSLWACQNSAPASTKSEEPKEEVQSEVEDRSQEEPVKVVDNTVEEEEKIPEKVEEESVPANPALPEDDVMKGHYSYFADVGYFKNCADNQNYLVRLKRSTVKMESDYLKLMKETNEKIFVKVKGQIENTGREKTLIVEEYLGFFPEESCD
jgi:uncharacterized lipoprotein NlpE involved in copper resistance